jgi:glycosyltransferase involved in cell wall biosynthesis
MAKEKKFISIVSPTFNEVENIAELYLRVTNQMELLPYDYEFIIIDNDSTDGTVEKLRELAKEDTRLKLILNETNFGQLRSPYHGLLSASGEAVILLASDLQDPPELIPNYLDAWNSGSKVVLAVKESTDENPIISLARKSYYKFVERISATAVTRNATGAGLFDNSVISTLRSIEDPVPYFRGLVSELGYKIQPIYFHQPKRKQGKTKNNFFSLIDVAILGFTSQAKAPMRLISAFGLLTACLSLIVAFVYLVAKILFWNSIDLGITPILFGVFFFGAIQVFLIGVIGEYLASIQIRIRKLPHVIERERINF